MPRAFDPGAEARHGLAVHARAALVIRRATAADAGSLAEIKAAAVRALCRGGYGERQIESWTRPRDIERLQAQVAADPAFVACLGAELVGYSQVRPSSGEILAVYVRPTSTGQGIGAALLAAAEQAALGSGSGLCSLWVDASLNAEVFYAACGYVAQRKTSFVLDDGVELPCVRMGKSALARNAP